MNTTRKIAVVFATLVVLVLSIGIIYAQDNGNSSGNGNGPGVAACCDQTQIHTYNNGGIGFGNAQNGAAWNDRQRGNMGNRRGGQNGTGLHSTLPPAFDGELPEDIVDLMVDGWLDEQHAYAVYEAVIEQFGEVAPPVNIQRAEAQHAAAWELMFDRYDITVPDMPDFGEFPEFATLADACQAAIDAEIANFELYDTMQDAFSIYPDIAQIATSLSDASEFNHLPAFESCAQ
jgi:hypothetical protein